MDFSPSFPDYRLCQGSAPTDGVQHCNVRVLRGFAFHSLLRVQNQPQKENQRTEKWIHEDCFAAAPAFHMRPGSNKNRCHLAGVGPIANLIAGVGGAAAVASKQAPPRSGC